MANYSNRVKASFLKSGAGVFGVHLQGKTVRFLDADFCNVLEIRHYLGEKTLPEINSFLNLKLKIKNSDLILNVPNNINEVSDLISTKSVDDFIPRIYIRFNSFIDALKAYQIFKDSPLKHVSLIYSVFR